MRVAALCVLVAMSGCALPPAADEPAPGAAAEEPLCAAVEEPEEPHVPQDEYNLIMLERCRKDGREPLHQDLANGRFRYGRPLTDVTGAYPPPLLLNHGDYTTALYAREPRGRMDCVYVIVRKGKMIHAFGSSCVWHPVFFDGMNDQQRKEWSDSYDVTHRAHYNLPPKPPAAPPPVPNNGAIAPPREAGKPTP